MRNEDTGGPGSEFRRCSLTGRWVVVAPERAGRPLGLSRVKPQARVNVERAVCPFCPGMEHDTPSEVYAVRDDQSNWQLRVVPNKFPAVSPERRAGGVGPPSLLPETLGGPTPPARLEGFGVHEVVIECPEHEPNPVRLTDDQFQQVLIAYRERLRALAADPRVGYVTVFKNVGAEAGASLAHPHSQLLTTPFVPPAVADELAGAEAYHRATGRNVFRDMLEEEAVAAPSSPSPALRGRGSRRRPRGEGEPPSPTGSDPLTPALSPEAGEREKEKGSAAASSAPESRLVASSPAFAAVCPFAPRFAYEFWVFPRRPASRYETITDAECQELAVLLKRVLAALDEVLNEPAYNLYLHTAPPRAGELPYYQWHFEVVPRTDRAAGFEWATGVFIHAVPPERAAAELRARMGERGASAPRAETPSGG